MLRPTDVSIFLSQDLWQTDGTLDELVVAESIKRHLNLSLNQTLSVNLFQVHIK